MAASIFPDNLQDPGHVNLGFQKYNFICFPFHVLSFKNSEFLTCRIPFDVLGLVKQSTGDHCQQKCEKTASDSLETCEHASLWPDENGHPQVVVGDVDSAVLGKQLREGHDIIDEAHWCSK